MIAVTPPRSRTRHCCMKISLYRSGRKSVVQFAISNSRNSPKTHSYNLSCLSKLTEMSTTTESATLPVFALDERDIPANAIPSLPSLGATYNVLNGLYADARSCLQVVVDWPNLPFHNVTFGDKIWGVPDMVNYNPVSRTEFNSTFGKSADDYSRALSSRTELGTEWPFFSGSVSVDFSQSETNNLANAFTRVTNEVTLYTLSLPPPLELQMYLRPAFLKILDSADPQLIYEQYGTHIVSNMIIGGRAAFTCTTDTTRYSASDSVEVAAQVSVKAFMGTLSASEQLKYQETIDSFQESSTYRVLTEGGDAKYGNQNFLNNIDAWSDSVKSYPAFVDFGGTPAFTALYQLASTKARQDELKDAYATYCKNYSTSLIVPGPYLRARFVSSNPRVAYFSTTDYRQGRPEPVVFYAFSFGLGDGYVGLSQQFTVSQNITYNWPDGAPVKALVPGVVVPVTRWEIFRDFIDNPNDAGLTYTRIWRGYGPTNDYVVMSHIAYT
ncbi:MAC/Perforin domain-containing protein [Armillaria luteobubalina]|uniref:MAC/Perforin domain-containing protein n=1 Tax=Armillaria luteobubalina TaxID=153913 RepID=A0AA39UXL3_9AGAR|nr:MAC/Perforin domain-containing protein [Armillaria luteobubalina]